MSDELYLEKLKISERLQSVENTLLAHSTEIKAAMKTMQETLTKHSEEIWGNSHPGIKTNLDRLMQIEDGRKWFLRGAGLSIFGLLSKTIWDLFKRP